MLQPPLNRSRNDKFILVLDIPKALKNRFTQGFGDFFNVDPLQISIFGSPVPAISVPSIKIPYGGQSYQTSSFSRPEYTSLNIKFLVDNNYKNYWIIWSWLNLLNDAKKSTSDANISISELNITEKQAVLKNPMSDFTSRFWIYGLDEYNKRIISFEYTHAFPTNLSELNYSNQDPTEISCTVSFVFNQLEVELLNDLNKAVC
jgi:hypothetical protein